MPTDQIQSSLAILAHDLRLSVNQIRRRIRQEGAANSLTEAQRTVLRLLTQQGPQTVTELATREGIRSQSMGETVRSLEALGLLTRSPDPRDGRQSMLALSPHGTELLAKNRKAREDWLQHAIQTRLTPAEQTLLAQAVPLLQRLAQEK